MKTGRPGRAHGHLRLVFKHNETYWVPLRHLNTSRRYAASLDDVCKLLGYSRNEILNKTVVPTPEKRDDRNVALRSHCWSAVRRALTDGENTALSEAQASTSAAGPRIRQNSRPKHSRLARFSAMVPTRCFKRAGQLW
jgi:hypothetical protein